MRKFECILILKFSFNGGLFFIFDFDITMTFFFNPPLLFSLANKHNVIISKIHYESIIF